MRISGLHLLLTYQCNYECDHCFVWGGPGQSGTMTLADIREIIAQAEQAGGVEWIYFEGGEPFLYFPVLLEGVRLAASRGFKVGIVSNGYWATSKDDALACLRPMAGLVQDFSISGDTYHWTEERQTRDILAAGEELGIPVSVISIAEPEATHLAGAKGQIPEGESAVVFRGRAVEKLSGRADRFPWQTYTECPFEDLEDPGRVHIDPLGYVHICQGISIGNLFKTPLAQMFADYRPETHPITGPLQRGGPAELVRRHEVDCRQGYCDACHLCYEARQSLRTRFPDQLAPGQMYGDQVRQER
jgi:MoaA/NifB/PqqE/SkfB family radical SAM enzyme